MDHDGGTNPDGKDSSDICRHPDENNSGVTVFAWIVQPKGYKVYWTRGQPCETGFKEYDLLEFLG